MSAQPERKSAIVILVPEAEMLVGRHRLQFDPSAAKGMPAHVTLLYPFADPARITPDCRAILRACLAEFSAFAFQLSIARQSPTHLLYLAPAPAEIFRKITFAIWARFPDFPP
ncbi:MAG TPA: 2'-5' RNA ligase family protein, partial [Dongiaceae bacterium]